MGKAFTEQLKSLDTTSLASKVSSLTTVNMKDVIPSTEEMFKPFSIQKAMKQNSANAIGK